MTRKQICIIVLVLVLPVAVVDMFNNGFTFFENYIDQPGLSGLVINTEIMTQVFDHKEMVVDPGNREKLILYNPAGSVIITGNDDDQIKIQARVYLYTEDVNLAEDCLDEFQLVSKKGFDSIRIDTDDFEFFPKEIKGMRVDYIVTAPKNLKLDIESSDYVQIENFANKVKTRNFGLTEISKITGDLTLGLSGQNDKLSKVTDIEGKITVSHLGGKVEFANIKGDIFNYGRDGEIIFSHIQGNIRGNYSDLQLTVEDVQGKLIVESSDTNFNINTVTDLVKIRAINQRTYKVSALTLDDVHDVNIDGEKIGISITSALNHQIDAETYLGKIVTADDSLKLIEEKHIRKLTGKTGSGEYTLKVKTSYADIAINEDITNSNI